MKKFFLIALFALTISSASAQVQVNINVYDDYESYIPSGYFHGNRGELIHYYGQGYFLIGYPTGRGGYVWDEVYMDFNPLHNMIRTVNHQGLGAIHIAYHNGQWVWMISYSDIHYYGHHHSWTRCNTVPIRYTYCDWGYNYRDLQWRNQSINYNRYYDNNNYYRRDEYRGSNVYGRRLINDGGNTYQQSTVNRTYSVSERPTSTQRGVTSTSRSSEATRDDVRSSRSSSSGATTRTTTTEEYSRSVNGRVTDQYRRTSSDDGSQPNVSRQRQEQSQSSVTSTRRGSSPVVNNQATERSSAIGTETRPTSRSSNSSYEASTTSTSRTSTSTQGSRVDTSTRGRNSGSVNTSTTYRSGSRGSSSSSSSDANTTTTRRSTSR